MTDKQIIIDGVDVSGCCCYENGKCLWTKRYYENNIVPDCKKVKNCYYKQLKRKEQACEELKIYIESNEQQVKEVETLVMDNDRLINELDQLKSENGELKRELMQYEKDVKDLNYFSMKLKQTLTQIKEIAEKQCVCGVDCIDMKQILQKISEVEE